MKDGTMQADETRNDIEELNELLREASARILAIPQLLSVFAVDGYGDKYLAEVSDRLTTAKSIANGMASKLNCTDPHPGQLETDTRGAIADAEGLVSVYRAHLFPAAAELSNADTFLRGLSVGAEDIERVCGSLNACCFQLSNVAVHAVDPTTSSPESMLTQQQAADYLGVTTKTIRSYVNLGMPEHRLGKSPRYSKKEIWDWSIDC